VAGLSDQDLLMRLKLLAGREREATVELVAHLAALDSRPAVCAAQGYGTLVSYCTQVLRLSEDAACNRIEAARACRRFPVILDRLTSGEVTLTSVRLLGRHLTPENHQAVLANANGRSRQQIEALVAELAPRPDVPTSVRRLPTFTTTATPSQAASGVPSEPSPAATPSPAALSPTPRPIVQATAPERYRVQFTIGAETHEKLRHLQRREADVALERIRLPHDVAVGAPYLLLEGADGVGEQPFEGESAALLARERGALVVHRVAEELGAAVGDLPAGHAVGARFQAVAFHGRLPGILPLSRGLPSCTARNRR
jgi:hypothetical protein